MSPSTHYDIVTSIKIADQATSAARNITSQTTGMSWSMFKAGTAAIVAANAIMKGFGKAANTVGEFARQIVELNQAFEDQRLALSALVNANLKYQDATGQQLSPAENLKASVGVAEEQLKQFVDAAKTAPGTARDFSQIGQFIIDPYLKAGGQMGGDFTDLIKKMLIAGQFTGQAQEVTALDAQQMLQGLAKSRDRLPKLLGLDPESINKMKPDERLKAVRDALNNVVTPDTMRLLENSFTTIKATFSENIDILKRLAGQGVFERYSKSLKQFNDYFLANTPALTEISRAVLELASALGEVALQPLLDSIQSVGKAISSIDTQGVAAIRAFANSIGDALTGMQGVASAVDSVRGSTTDMVGTMRSATIAIAAFAAQIGALKDTVLAVSPAGVAKDIADIIAQGSLGMTDRIMGRENIHWNNAIEAVNSLQKNIDSISGRQIVHGPAEAAQWAGAVFDRAFEQALKTPAGPNSAVGNGKGAIPQHKIDIGEITINQNFKDNADPDRIAFKVREVFDKLKDRPLTSNKRFRLGGL